MKITNDLGRGKQAEQAVPAHVDFARAAYLIYEKALEDAWACLHPLLRSADVRRLNRRLEFVQAFRLSLEQRLAQMLVTWQPAIQAVFRFDESWMDSREHWDGSIYLLVKVPRVSNSIRAIGIHLDKSLLKCLRQLGWTRFQSRQSVLEIQQVTPQELRHGIGYGAMFCAVYSRPVKVWPGRK